MLVQGKAFTQEEQFAKFIVQPWAAMTGKQDNDEDREKGEGVAAGNVSITLPILQETNGGDFHGDEQISWPQPPARRPLYSTGHFSEDQPTHLLG